jgi:hypothetical protein
MRGLALVAAVAALSAGCSEDTRSLRASPSGCPAVHPMRPSSRALSAFFPLRPALLLRGRRCVYLVSRSRAATRLLWAGRTSESVRGLGWSPDGESIAITTKSGHHGWRVVILRRDGAVQRRLRATGISYLRDGRVVISRRDGIYLQPGFRRLAPRAQLQLVAGFRLRMAVAVSPDPFGYGRGYGRKGVALTLWGGPSASKSAALVVSADGRVTRASPAYHAGGGEGSVLGWTWSSNGRKLFVTAEIVPPNWQGPGDHDHCVYLWSAEHGRRRAFCGSTFPRPERTHFARLVWATDGKRGLLDNGTLITADGRASGRLDVPALAFELQRVPAGR